MAQQQSESCDARGIRFSPMKLDSFVGTIGKPSRDEY